MPQSVIVEHFILYKTVRLFAKVVVPYSILPAVYEWSSFSAFLSASSIVTVFQFSHSGKCVVMSYCGFNLHFPDA